MNRILFVFSTLIIGFILQIVSHRYLALFYVGPDVLLILVLSSGFLLGPLMGEIMGFSWGLMADCLGVNFFGLQSFLFAVIGYAAGHLRRRVDGERPIPQVAITVLVTLFYSLGSALLRSILDQSGQRISAPMFVLQSTYNAAVATPLFWIMA